MTEQIILALEPSATIQCLLSQNLPSENCSFHFERDVASFIDSITELKPAAVLVNAGFDNPGSYEIVRLIKTMDEMNGIPAGFYSSADVPFEDYLIKNCGADCFFSLTENVREQIAILLKLSNDRLIKKTAVNESLLTSIQNNFFLIMKNWSDFDALVARYLNLTAEYLQVPAVAVFLLKNDTPCCYYVCANDFPADRKNEFLKVSRSDFDGAGLNTKSSKILCFKCSSKNIDRYHQSDIPLSSYHHTQIMDSGHTVIGSLHVVCNGNISNAQMNLLYYISEQSGLIFENALLLEKKLFFEKRIRKAFSRFVPEQIIDELVENSNASDKIAVGEKRNVAVLFSDIRSFTNISECNKPETIVAFLNRYFSIMCEIIKKYGGTVDKFIGDAIMALFGAPVSYEDNSRRAVAAAVEMRQALETVPLEDLVLPAGMKFNIGIGINYGDLIVGSIGSKDKTDYSVIGDNVNLASRLEGLTKTYGSMIVISQSTKDDIKEQDDFAFRYLDDVKVKGKAKAVPIFAVDKDACEFSQNYKDNYLKGIDLYKQGIFELAKEYFEKALDEVPEDKASLLMLDRCEEFIKNPPENWDGGFSFKTK